MVDVNDEQLVSKWSESGLLDLTTDKVQLARVLEDISVQCFTRLSKGDVTREQVGKVALYAFPLATRVLGNKDYRLVSGNDGSFNTESVYVNTSATNEDDEVAAVTKAASQLNERIGKYNNLQIAAFKVGLHEDGFVAEIVCR